MAKTPTPHIGAQFGEIAERLEDYGRKSGLEIHIQREEIFDAMHRI